MNPKEQAEIMFNKFYGVPLYQKSVKDCCLIAVAFILNEYKCSSDVRKEYWEQVKEEIQKL
jgi:phage gp36-like protein